MAQNPEAVKITEDVAQMIYVTAPNQDEARAIAKAVVGERLAACANVLEGVSSIYWWDGALQEDRESVLIFKTRRELVAKLTARIKALHSYDCPCVVALKIDDGNTDYLNWIVSQTT